MITQVRKSKYKHKITVPYKQYYASQDDKYRESEMRQWCEQSYGPGGRKHRWRFGWTDKEATFYFRQPKDAMMFTLRWAS